MMMIIIIITIDRLIRAHAKRRVLNGHYYHGRGLLVYENVGMRERYPRQQVRVLWPPGKLDGGHQHDGDVAGCFRTGYAQFDALRVFDHGDPQVSRVGKLAGTITP